MANETKPADEPAKTPDELVEADGDASLSVTELDQVSGGHMPMTPGKVTPDSLKYFK